MKNTLTVDGGSAGRLIAAVLAPMPGAAAAPARSAA
jgi:hypothetical protein